MMGLSITHLLILLFVVLLFGAKRLPELGSSLGKGLRAFKKGLDGKHEETGSGSKNKIDGPEDVHKPKKS